MNALDLILEDHKKIREILDQLDYTIKEESNDHTFQIRTKIFHELETELLRHEKMEQDFFYPIIKKDPYKDVIKHLIDEENETSKFLQSFKENRINSPEWLKKYNQLKTKIEQHTKEEETKLFPIVKKIIPEPLLISIGNEMNKFRKRAKQIRI